MKILLHGMKPLVLNTAMGMAHLEIKVDHVHHILFETGEECEKFQQKTHQIKGEPTRKVRLINQR